MNLEQELGPKLKYGVKKNEPMARHTSWLVGGPADYFLCPANLTELLEIVRYSYRYQLPLYILGNGTNLLVLDGGIRGLVVNIGASFSAVDFANSRLTAGSGASMAYLAKSAAEAGLSGFEFAIGIPGTLGGALIMNAGAFGGYVGNRVRSVKLVDFHGRLVTVQQEELSFGYRTSNLAGKGIIVEADLELEKGDPVQVNEKMERFSADRRRRHPKLPSAGSVFRNFSDQPAGLIIEKAGAKGLRIGGAEISEEHANFIVNTGDATAADILHLIKTVRQMVKDIYGLELQPEVRIIGEER